MGGLTAVRRRHHGGTDHSSFNSFTSEPDCSSRLTAEAVPANPPSRHHYIPIFYSQWWAVDGVVQRYTNPYKRVISVRRCAPSEVGWERDLYASPDPKARQHLEQRAFGPLDNSAARALVKLNARPVVELTESDTLAWSLFIMSLLNRTPEAMAAGLEAGERIWRRTAPRAREKFLAEGGDGAEEAVAAYVSSLTPDEPTRAFLRILPGVIANPKINTFIANMQWVAIDLPEGCPDLLLSDDPLARTNGIAKPGGHLALPLSPRRLMIAAWDQDTLGHFRQQPAKETAKELNRWVVESARRFVVARDRSQTRFIQNRFGRNPKAAIARAIGHKDPLR